MTKPASEIALTRAIGERLRHARESAGWSLAGLAERTDGRLSKSRIYNYEQGSRRMSIETARILAEALGTLTPATLLGLDDPLGLAPDERALLEHYRASDPTDRAEILRRASQIRGDCR